MRLVFALFVAALVLSVWLFSPKDEGERQVISMPQVLRIAPPEKGEGPVDIGDAISAAVAGAAEKSSQYQGNAEAIAADQAEALPDPRELAAELGLSKEELRRRLTPPDFEPEYVVEIIDRSLLSPVEKVQLIEELTTVIDQPEILAKFLMALRQSLGFDD